MDSEGKHRRKSTTLLLTFLFGEKGVEERRAKQQQQEERRTRETIKVPSHNGYTEEHLSDPESKEVM